jgi:hypothetical protein
MFALTIQNASPTGTITSTALKTFGTKPSGIYDDLMASKKSIFTGF